MLIVIKSGVKVCNRELRLKSQHTSLQFTSDLPNDRHDIPIRKASAEIVRKIMLKKYKNI